MSKTLVSRRATLTALASLVTLPALAQPAAAPTTHFRAIEVDLGPLRASGDSESAAVMAKELPGWLQHYFAAYLTPGDRRAPILRARVDSVSYGIAGSAGPMFNSTMDYVEGAGVVIGGSGRQVASYPITSAVLAHPDLTDVTGQSAHIRISNLAQSFAQGLPGKMGL